MGTVVLAIVLCILLPLLLMSVYMDRRGRRMIISLNAGIIACLIAYFLNNNLMDLSRLGSVRYTIEISPVVEELLKFLPILAINAYYKKGRRGSAALSFAVGVGFCVVENYFYLMNVGTGLSIPWIIARSVGTGLMHCMSSAIIGIGVYYARQERHMRLQCISGSFALAVTYHGLYNLLVQSGTLQLVGIAMPICTYLFIFIFMNNNDMQKLLLDVKTKTEESEPQSGNKY